LEGLVGYKYAKNKSKPFEEYQSMTIVTDAYNYAERMPFSKGIFTGLAFKFYPNSSISDRNRLFISPQFFYRYRFYDHQYVITDDFNSDPNEDPRTTLQSLDLHIFGAKLLAGKTFSIMEFENKSNIALEVYTGIGLRQKMASTTYYYTLSSERITAESTFWSFHLGFKLGYRF